MNNINNIPNIVFDDNNEIEMINDEEDIKFDTIDSKKIG